ncbi:MAG: DUF2878 domain-containing protein [Candidatus Competibacteraceae bacterium]
MSIAVNILSFYLGWFACVLGAARNVAWVGTVAALLLIILHLWRRAWPASELRLILLSGGVGLVLDSLPVALGLVAYPSGTIMVNFAPYWIIVLWMLFATTLNSSLSWLQGRLRLAALLGAVAGPLAYYSGARMGGMALLEPWPALSVLALGWSLALPLLLSWTTRDAGTAGTDRQNAGHGGSARAEKPA